MEKQITEWGENMYIKVPKIDSEPISTKVKKMLLQLMKEDLFAPEGKLPAEDILAGQLGVSRTVLRDALGALEAEGYITRRRSIGTTINRYILNAQTRIDLQKEFQEMIAEAGYEAGFRLLSAAFLEQTPAWFSGKGEKGETESFLEVEKLFMADGQPAIYCVDYVPARILPDTQFDLRIFEEISIFTFLKEYCHQEVFMSLSSLEALEADASRARVLGIREGAPVLTLHEKGYDINQMHVLNTEVAIRNGIFSLEVLRKKI